jgi:hypothetical protein
MQRSGWPGNNPNPARLEIKAQAKQQPRSFHQTVLAAFWCGFVPDNQITLLQNGAVYFPAIEAANLLPRAWRTTGNNYLPGYHFWVGSIPVGYA